jgi:hypothetical protein
MTTKDPTPQVGEIVSALARFAPQTLERVKAKYPGQDVFFRPGEVLGNTPVPISCALALELLPRYATAAAQIFKRMRRRLGVSWWIDLIAKLAATSGAAGTIAAYFTMLSAKQGAAAGLVALLGSFCGLLVSLLQRDVAGGPLTASYNRLADALVEANQQEIALRTLCPAGSGKELNDALTKASEVARTLVEMDIRYG